MKKIRIHKLNDSFRYDGALSYLIVYNHSAGLKNVFNVYIETLDDPVRIGCELDLPFIRTMIPHYEEEARKRSTHPLKWFIGDHQQVTQLAEHVLQRTPWVNVPTRHR